MKKLRPHRANPINENDILVSYSVEQAKIVISFEVICHEHFVSTDFCEHSFSNIGLWDYDVVEVFIQRKSENNHYLELQVSPLGQKFALLVKSPRKETEQLYSLKSQISSHKTNAGFKAIFSVDPSDIPGTSDELYANFFACLGPKESRSYFALNINSDNEPDYHRPELFEYIGTIK